jgi:hypothetical protein
MATALQCPDCGCKHRLDAIGDRAVFECSKCGRQLKVPQQYRPSTAPSKNGGSTSAPRPVGGSARSAPRTAAKPRPKHQVGANPMRLPVRILLWVVAFVLGAVVVRTLAKWTGFAGGDTFFDLLIDGSFGTYLRLFALVPVWALFATIFATLMIDGPRIWANRSRGAVSGTAAAPRAPRPKPAPGAASGSGVSAVAPGAGAAAGAGAVRATQRTIPRREPKASPMPEPPPVAPPVTKTAVVPVATAPSESVDDPAAEYAARAAAGQRPRRIPRRGAGS